MKYLVLRKRLDIFEDPFSEMVAAGAEASEHAFPFDVTSVELNDRDAGELRREEDIEEVVPSMPFKLIAPVENEVEDSGVTNGGIVKSKVGGQVTWGVAAVRADTSPQDGTGVTVAILDTGIDIGHPGFSGLAFPAEDLMDFTVNEAGATGSAPDMHGHGTHVAGTLVGREINTTRIGVAPGVAKVLVGKVLGPQGGATEAVYNAIEWALKRRADVISMSLGMDFPGAVARLIEQDFPADIAASRALEAYRSNVRLFDRVGALVETRISRGRGALLVAASGNESCRNDNPKYTVNVAPPAVADGFISVGAVQLASDTARPFAVADFSNTGCLLSAPGVSVLSAKFGGGLIALNGTSMATPHVAGVVALWIQKLFPGGERPNGWARDVQRAVEQHIVPSTRQTRNDIGLGIVQAPQ